MAAGSLQELKKLLPVLRHFESALVLSARFVSSSSDSPIAPKGPQSVEKSRSQPKDVMSEKSKPTSVLKEEVYKNQQYFNYNEDSYIDLEMEIINTGKRQTQPDPMIFYKHSDPWQK